MLFDDLSSYHLTSGFFVKRYDYTEAAFADNLLKQVLASKNFFGLVAGFDLDQLTLFFVVPHPLARLPIRGLLVSFLVHRRIIVACFFLRIYQFKVLLKFIFTIVQN